MSDPVKICPTCGALNAPVAQRCACGVFLIGVDLVERPVVLPDDIVSGAASAPAAVVEQTVASADAPVAASAPASCALDGTTQSSQPAALLICPHTDCAQPNPPATRTCLYCNRPMASSGPVQPAPRASAEKGVATSPGGGRRLLINLPAPLASRLDVVEPLKAAGGEADLFVVRDRASGERAVLKLYRHGVEPKTEVLERVSRSAADQVVRLIDFGVAEDVPYELLEYCEHGSLRALFKGKPIPADAARVVLTELAEAIAHLHGHGVVHRDLKPENVLVRGLLPLDLVLTDFGISSVASATMHYTSAARTLRYSAPETGSNWVGKPSDYWSLGMMLAEALAGRHPFDGLSEAVIAHQLVTKPVDLSGVGDARWRLLCRGLLLRDPQARWGAGEVERWLANDTTLTVEDEPAAAAVAAENGVKPYSIQGEQCRAPRELAVALARHWVTGAQDLRRGILRAWVQNDLRDQELTRFLMDLEEDPTAEPDEKLVRLIVRLDPSLPPVYLGYDASRPGLVAATAKALAGDSEMRQLVAGLLERKILRLYPVTELHDLQDAYDAACADVEQAVARARAAGAPASIRPQGDEWRLQLFAALAEPDGSAIEALRAQARTIAAGAARACPWYAALGSPDERSPARVALLVLTGAHAARDGIARSTEGARCAHARLGLLVDGNARLDPQLGERWAALRAKLDDALDDREALALPDEVLQLERAVRAALAAAWEQEVFAARRITDDEQIGRLRERVSRYAAERAGEGYRDFGARIEIVAAVQRRAYTVRVDSQIEARRTPYKYSESDLARMPESARAAFSDPYTCAMPALPRLAADYKHSAAAEVRCPRCGQTAPIKMNEGWGQKSFAFSTGYACHDKVGIQTQVRSHTDEERVRPLYVSDEVSDLVQALATEEPSPSRTVEIVGESIDEAMTADIPDGPIKQMAEALVARARAEVEAGQRITVQRLRLRWTGLTEVRYRYEGREWVLWVPAREDRKPIDLQSPLPKEPLAAPADATYAAPIDPEPAAPAAPVPVHTIEASAKRTGKSGGWMRALAIWVAVLAALWLIVKAVVNWRPPG